MSSTPIKPDEITWVVANVHTQERKDRYRGKRKNRRFTGFRVRGLAFTIRQTPEESDRDATVVGISELRGTEVSNQLDDYFWSGVQSVSR